MDKIEDDKLILTFVPETAFQRRMAQGHVTRTGHELRGYYTAERPPEGQAPIWELVHTCACADVHPVDTGQK